MIHRLANVRSRRDGFEVLSSLAADTQNMEYESVEVSFAGVDWFDANMAAPLGAVLARLRDRYNTVSIVDLAWSQESILRRNGFLASYGYPAPVAWGGTVMPYMRFKTTDANPVLRLS